MDTKLGRDTQIFYYDLPTIHIPGTMDYLQKLRGFSQLASTMISS